jgi:hypothetical protein
VIVGAIAIARVEYTCRDEVEAGIDLRAQAVGVDALDAVLRRANAVACALREVVVCAATVAGDGGEVSSVQGKVRCCSWRRRDGR